MPEINKTVGRPRIGVEIDAPLLRKVRKERGLKQIEVAAYIGYTPARVTQFEAGTPFDVPLDTLKKIAEFLEVDHEIFLVEKLK